MKIDPVNILLNKDKALNKKFYFISGNEITLMKKIEKAAKETQINDIAIAGGVSANSGLRMRLTEMEQSHQWRTHIPPFSYCTDNAAMIAITGYYKYLNKEFCSQEITAKARLSI